MIDNDYFVVWYVLRAGGVRFSGHGAQTGIEDSVTESYQRATSVESIL